LDHKTTDYGTIDRREGRKLRVSEPDGQEVERKKRQRLP
jgi:hypothetical protein